MSYSSAGNFGDDLSSITGLFLSNPMGTVGIMLIVVGLAIFLLSLRQSAPVSPAVIPVERPDEPEAGSLESVGGKPKRFRNPLKPWM